MHPRSPRKVKVPLKHMDGVGGGKPRDQLPLGWNVSFYSWGKLSSFCELEWKVESSWSGEVEMEKRGKVCGMWMVTKYQMEWWSGGEIERWSCGLVGWWSSDDGDREKVKYVDCCEIIVMRWWSTSAEEWCSGCEREVEEGQTWESMCI